MVKEESNDRPFVTIGVTTYDRHDLLRQTLDSILAQTFTDFEVIVGNDYTVEVLTGEMLGITDPRVRFVNHSRNLGEIGNMNALLGMAKGRYFTWLFDDDLYEPGFLQAAYESLAERDFPPVFFSSFRFLRQMETFQPQKVVLKPVVEFTGPGLLRWYSPRRMQIASVLGLFDVAAFRNIVGGLEELCPSAIGVYSEYLLLVQCALFDRIVFVDAPLVVYRVHSGSWSESPFEFAKYTEAGRELVRRCAEVLRNPALSGHFNAILLKICEQHLVTLAHRSAKLECINKGNALFAIYGALIRYGREASATRQNFVKQGGDRGIQTKLAFLKMNIQCCSIILFNLAYYFFRGDKVLKGNY